MGLLDNEKMEITCANCTKKFAVSVGQVRRSTEITCPACRTNIDTKQAAKDLDRVSKATDELAAQFRKLGR